jgi:hypothetical protein
MGYENLTLVLKTFVAFSFRWGRRAENATVATASGNVPAAVCINQRNVDMQKGQRLTQEAGDRLFDTQRLGVRIS